MTGPETLEQQLNLTFSLFFIPFVMLIVFCSFFEAGLKFFAPEKQLCEWHNYAHIYDFRKELEVKLLQVNAR